MNLIVGSDQPLATKMRNISCQPHKVAFVPAVNPEVSRTEVSALPLFKNSRITAKHWHEGAQSFTIFFLLGLQLLLPISPWLQLNYITSREQDLKIKMKCLYLIMKEKSIPQLKETGGNIKGSFWRNMALLTWCWNIASKTTREHMSAASGHPVNGALWGKPSEDAVFYACCVHSILYCFFLANPASFLWLDILWAKPSS